MSLSSGAEGTSLERRFDLDEVMAVRPIHGFAIVISKVFFRHGPMTLTLLRGRGLQELSEPPLISIPLF